MVRGEPQKELVHNTDWDILIIIDACRYDYFEKIHREALDDIGVLKKTLSPATWTFGWHYEIFGDKKYNDIILCSTTESINSMCRTDLYIRDFAKRLKYQKFIGVNCWYKIIDVWKAWDDTFFHVHPKDVNRIGFDTIDKYPDKRVIIKYTQIHDPYLFYGGFFKKKTSQGRTKQKNTSKTIKFVAKYEKRLHKIFRKILTSEQQWVLSEKLGVLPQEGMGRLFLMYGWDGIRKGYTEDLKMVLKYVREIIDRYPDKKIVITADHGIILGEGGNIREGKKHPLIAQVPWYEVNL